MDEMKIELKDGYNVFREMYYRDGQGSILTWKGTRKPIIAVLIFGLFTIISYLLALKYPYTEWIVSVILSSLGTFGVFLYILIKGRIYFKWKRGVEKYLNRLLKYESQWLTVTVHTIALSNSDETSIEKWENIKSVSIYPDYIVIRGGVPEAYQLPEKSMTSDQFAELKEFVLKIMNGYHDKVLQVHDVK